MDCFADSVGSQKSEVKDIGALRGTNTHITVFLFGQLWLQVPFWGPHLHLQLGELKKDTKVCKQPAFPWKPPRAVNTVTHVCTLCPLPSVPFLDPVINCLLNSPKLACTPGLALFRDSFRVSSLIQESFLSCRMTASLISANNSMACGDEVRKKKNDIRISLSPGPVAVCKKILP